MPLRLQRHFWPRKHSPVIPYKRSFRAVDPPSPSVWKAQNILLSQQRSKAPLQGGTEVCGEEFPPIPPCLSTLSRDFSETREGFRCAPTLTVSEASQNPTEALQWNSTDAKIKPANRIQGCSARSKLGQCKRIWGNWLIRVGFFSALQLHNPRNQVFICTIEAYFCLAARGIQTQNSQQHY